MFGGYFSQEAKMGPRINKKHHQKNVVNTAKKANKVVTGHFKSDTIAEVDFFGFPAECFWQDLKRTGWASLATILILIMIKMTID